ncbi:hypothetical protein F5X96DRAFT_624787 [Biscogniauxia mediterranea]|nr:hypothetical protein F5X96DRAFT_624787 [Biscogniauxia mediterranea]
MTRFAVTCQIFLKDLALANIKFATCSHENVICSLGKHESYVVLPRCGHAFGAWCLNRYFSTQRTITSTCPSCRKPILEDLEGKKVSVTFRSKAPKQQDEIVDIRKSF